MPSACAENDPLLLSQFLVSMTTVRRRRSAILLIIATWAVVSASSVMGHDREWGIDLAAPEEFCKLDLASTTQLSSAPSNSWSRHWDLATTPSSVGKRQTGRITFDLRGTSFSVSTGAPELGTLNGTETSDDKSISQQYEQVSLSTDPASTIHLIHLLGLFSLNFGSAFMGTLRLLAPLIVSRRALNAVGDLVMDYMRGRYLRTTYTRLESMYVRYYELPAAFRAACRTLAQLVILVLLNGIMGWMVGVHHAPCSIDRSCPRMWCALLWIVAVVGTGHACSTAVAVWGGPLRIQVGASHMHTGRSLAARVFTRPWHILQWMQDPEQWITMISTPQSYVVQQPFEPNPILFPSTWVPLRFLQMLAVAKAASSTPRNWKSSRDPVRTVVWSLLTEIALADEWYRVFIGERRVGLAVSVSLVYIIASISLALTAFNIDYVAGIMLIPTLLAVSVSGWMNVVIFWNRLEDRRRQATIDAFHMRRQAAMRALKWE